MIRSTLAAASTRLRRALLLLGLALMPALAHAGPDTVAVLYFHNQGNPTLEPLKVGLAQMLITDLQQAAVARPQPGRWTVVERSQLQALLDELELGHSGVVDADTAARLGKLLGAEWLVLGSYFELMGTLRVDSRLVKVETGEIAFAAGVDGGTADFRRMEGELAAGLATALAEQVGSAAGGEGEAEPGGPTGATGEGATSVEGARASGGSSGGSTGGSSGSSGGEVYVSGSPGATAVVAPDADALAAAVSFSEGLILLDRHDPERAREAFEAALVKDPALDAARASLAGLDL